MLTVRKRGKTYHADLVGGDTRTRGSLGTRNQDAAKQLVYRLERAISEGASSSHWQELCVVLPRSTYARFAKYAGVTEQVLPTWNSLREAFTTHMEQRRKMGKLQKSTEDRYNSTLREFDAFLGEQEILMLQDITKSQVESFKVWRMERIKKRKFARGATSLVLDAAILHRVFAFALEDEKVSETIVRNPVKMEGRPGENPEHGAEPFTAEELLRLREHAGQDLLAFLLLRWTGLRGSDAVSLTWREVHFDRGEIEKVTQKRRKKVILPIQTELLFALEAVYQRRAPRPPERVLLNPLTGNPLTRPRLYQRMLALGNRSSVSAAHPHRFRDTLAVDMLIRGANPYDVAKMLGDRIETVEQHYTPFVKELRERVRSILDNGRGLEDSVTPASQSPRTIQ